MAWIVEPGIFECPFLQINGSNYWTRWTPVLQTTASGGGFTGNGSLFCLRDMYTSDEEGPWTISKYLVPCIELYDIPHACMEADALLYNGLPWFHGDTYCLFYSTIRSAWVCIDGEIPVEPRAALGLDGETWEGDGWWETSGGSSWTSLPWSFAKKGTKLNSASSAAPNARLWWPRWTRAEDDGSQGPCGRYIAEDGYGLSPEERFVGLPVWKGSIGGRTVEFPRSFSKSNGRFSYGDLAWDRTRRAYVLGAAEAGSSWFETASAPTIDGGATLESKRFDDEGNVVAGADDSVVLAFDRLEFGDRTAVHALAEAVQWRST